MSSAIRLFNIKNNRLDSNAHNNNNNNNRNVS